MALPNVANDPTMKKNASLWRQKAIPLVLVAGFLSAMATFYLGYDYLTLRTAPCEAIFRDSALSLSTKIGFLKTNGEISLGRDSLIELSERSQMTALNLKTCCTVLDAGRLDAEQFLQCKAKARAYDNELEDIVALLRTKTRLETSSVTAGNLRPVETRPANAAVSNSQTIPRTEEVSSEESEVLRQKIGAARKISMSFNREVIQVRKSQAIEQLQLEKPKNVEVKAQEKEPNNDGLNTNTIPLHSWISASVGDGADSDMFSFETPAEKRDWISIEIDNRSTSLEPRIDLYDARKASLGVHYNTTPGADLTYRFVTEPKARYFVRIKNYYGKTTGVYLVRVSPEKAYDRFEPNDTILTPCAIAPEDEISAEIMDGQDLDFFRVVVPNNVTRAEVTIKNKSTTLRPRVDIYDEKKAHLGSKYNTTAGSDVSYGMKVNPGAPLFVRIKDYYGDAAGAYSLDVAFRKE